MAGREFVPTDVMRDQVKNMTLAGVQRDIVCKCVINPSTNKPITKKTLLKHFKDELELGDARVNGEVVAALYRTATGAPSGPQTAAAIFWAKTRLGWRETSKVQIEDDRAASATIEVPGQMAPDSWEEVAKQYDELGPPPFEGLHDDAEDDAG
ncbi:MAG: hypothetical protein ACR2RE_00195 [Geminicoccaceae bacterium]